MSGSPTDALNSPGKELPVMGLPSRIELNVLTSYYQARAWCVAESGSKLG